jgi:threonine/homoserine/homoserine lactone efflux protein
MDSSFAAFLGISAVVIMTPGQDTALTIRNTLLSRPDGRNSNRCRRRTGSSDLDTRRESWPDGPLVASAPAFAVIRLVDSGYLIYLGAHSIVDCAGRRALPAQSHIREAGP